MVEYRPNAMQHTLRTLAYIAAAAALVCLNSCQGGGTLAVNTDGEPAQPATGDPLAAVPLPPAEESATHLAQSALNHTFNQDDLYDATGATVTGNDICLEAEGLSWAILGIDLDYNWPESITLNGSSDGVYLGLSNFADDNWQWLEGPLTGAESWELPPTGLLSLSGIFYAVLACPDGNSADVQLSIDLGDDGDGVWNFMVWMAADNDLAPFAFQDIQELEAVGSNEHVNVLLGYDIDPALAPGVEGVDEVHFIKVVEDADDGAINTNGDGANRSYPREGYNSADPTNLNAFLLWSQLSFPEAQHRILVLWDHGDGWRAEPDT